VPVVPAPIASAGQDDFGAALFLAWIQS